MAYTFAFYGRWLPDATVEANFGGFLKYAEAVIEGKILHILEKDGELVGTGELRERQDWAPHADVGMIGAPRYRRRRARQRREAALHAPLSCWDRRIGCCSTAHGTCG